MCVNVGDLALSPQNKVQLHQVDHHASDYEDNFCM